MRKCTIALFFVGLLLACTAAFAGEYGGTWKAEVTGHETSCEDLGWDPVGHYAIEVLQSGDNLIVLPERPHVRYVGSLKPESPDKAHLQATYMKDGGYLTELVDLEFTSQDTAIGRTAWRWSDGVYACGGSYDFTLSRHER